jgi:hypothetical protein
MYMFNSSCNYSLSDIAAVTGGNGRNGDGMWGDGAWWIILLFLFAFNGGWGNGNGGFGGGRGQSEIAYSFDMNGLENGVRGIQEGLCDGFYAMNTGMLGGFSDVQSTLCQGFAGVNNAITTTGYGILDAVHADTIANMQNTTAINQGLTALGTQLAQCCCDNKYALATGFADINYNMATQACDTRRAIADSTRDIIDSNNAGVRSILDFLTQDKIASLTAENQALKFAASQATQNAFITANQEAQTAELIRRLGRDCPIPAYVVPNPNCCYNYAQPAYNNCGCGC